MLMRFLYANHLNHFYPRIYRSCSLFHVPKKLGHGFIRDRWRNFEFRCAMVKIIDILTMQDIRAVKDACALIRSAGISIQAVIIEGKRYEAPPERQANG